MFRIFNFVVLLVLALQSNAQNIWIDYTGRPVSSTAPRYILPQEYRVYRLDLLALKSILLSAPDVWSTPDADAPVIELPLSDGRVARFRVQKTRIMEAELQAKYPEIQCFNGVGLGEFSAARLKADVTPWGFHAQVYSPEFGTELIDPYAHGETEFYTVYNRKKYGERPDGLLRCGVEHAEENDEFGTPLEVKPRAQGDCVSRRYRLAVAATGEYTAFHGGTKALAQAAIVTSANRVNGILERESSISLLLVGKNDTLIFLDGSIDPYTNGAADIMIEENVPVLTSRIGLFNYDIGHVFGTNPSVYGLAQLQSVCTGSKGRGVSTINQPIGDNFDLIVAHEMGHQFGANHVQNNNCNRSGSSVEPGSGSTIMGYPGICAPNVQADADDYYNAISLEEISQFITEGAGNSCPVKTITGNVPPVVNSIPDYVIPRLTPFVLTAVAEDDNGDALTYTFDQMDNEVGQMPPNGTNSDGPMFRSRQPSLDSFRYFPRLQDVVNNVNPIWEVLPSIGRALNFRVTVRDNHPGGGCTAEQNIHLDVAANAGPFRVTSPNLSSVQWPIGQWVAVTWSVANTDLAPVNCKLVNVRLSLDGGFTYPVLLAEKVPNDGIQYIQVPNIPTTTARIRIDGVDNIFFDISNQSFQIVPPASPLISLGVVDDAKQVCAPNGFSTQVQTAASPGFSEPVFLTALSQTLPPGTVVTFAPQTVQPGETATVSFDFSQVTQEGAFEIRIAGQANGAASVEVPIRITVVQNNFSGLVLDTPTDGFSTPDVTQVLRWTKVQDANSYGVQIATTPTFAPGTIIAQSLNISLDSFLIPTVLQPGQVYYWRVQPVNECGPGGWTYPFAFVISPLNCSTYSYTGQSQYIGTSNTAVAELVVNVPVNAAINDINIKKISGNHKALGQLEVLLINPAGQTVELFKNKCGITSTNFNLGFDDQALFSFSCSQINSGIRVFPQSPLSIYNGTNPNGDWRLRARDMTFNSDGNLTGFELEVCAAVSVSPPQLIVNLPLSLPAGTNSSIGASLLRTIDSDNSPNELVYTILAPTQRGEIFVNGAGPLTLGSQFTQSDLDNDAVRYFSFGSDQEDAFRFAVTDGEGGLATGIFVINPMASAIFEVAGQQNFSLMPNPAQESVWVMLPEVSSNEWQIRLFDITGRLVTELNTPSGQTGSRLGLTGLSSGIYLVWVKTERGIGVKRLVVE